MFYFIFSDNDFLLIILTFLRCDNKAILTEWLMWPKKMCENYIHLLILARNRKLQDEENQVEKWKAKMVVKLCHFQLGADETRRSRNFFPTIFPVRFWNFELHDLRKVLKLWVDEFVFNSQSHRLKKIQLIA